jgi:hypothetical protein
MEMPNEVTDNQSKISRLFVAPCANAGSDLKKNHAGEEPTRPEGKQTT